MCYFVAMKKSGLITGKLYKNIRPLFVYEHADGKDIPRMIGKLNQVFLAIDNVNKILYKEKIMSISFQNDIDNGIQEISGKSGIKNS